MAATAKTVRFVLALLSVLVTSAGYAAPRSAGAFDPVNGLSFEHQGPSAPHANPSPARPPRWPRRDV